MNKTFDKSGFVIFSNSVDYELGILDRYFSSDILPQNIVFVYSKKTPVSDSYIYRLHQLNKNILIVPFEDYNKIEYASAIETLDLSCTVMVIKDLRFMLKRLDERLSMMQIKHRCYKKIVIDTVPFLLDMWKFYYPYSFFDKTLLGYSHSYAFEAAVRNYEEDTTLPDPYDPIVLANKVYPVTYVNYKKVFPIEVVFTEYNVSNEELAGYECLKESLFSSENSILKIIKGLHKYASSLCSRYNVPLKLDEVYGWTGTVEIFRTNLKVDTHLCSELMKLIHRSDTLIESLYGN